MPKGFDVREVGELQQYDKNPEYVRHPEVEVEEIPTILEDDFDPRLLEPGMYTAFSNTPAYPILYGLTLAGAAAFGGMRYLEGGVVQMLAVVGAEGVAEANPEDGVERFQASVVVPHAAFTSIAEEEYGDTTWQQMWWREVVQNAVDAGAKSVDLRIEEQDDGTWLASCQDDGHGMDVEAILGQFFTLKASKKIGETAIGGFGEAKKFIALAWLRFRVRSLDAEVTGAGATWPNLDASRGHSVLQGTLVEVAMPADKHTTEAAAIDFLAKCTLPGIIFTVNGKRTGAMMRHGEFKKALPYGTKLYLSKRNLIGGALVRANGLYMFTKDMPSDFTGTLSIELSPKRDEFPTPKDLFSATRMDLRANELGTAVRGLLQKARSDVREALRDPDALVRKEYEGAGQFSLRHQENEAALRDVMGELPPKEPGKGTGLRMQDEQKSQVLDLVQSVYGDAESEAGGNEAKLIGVLDREIAAVLASLDFKGESHVEAAVAQMVWKPDFLLMNDETMRKRFRIDKRFEPATMIGPVLALAKCWAEIVRLIFVATGTYTKWGTGFVFSKEVLGIWQGQPFGKKYICLNPFNLKTGKLLSIRDEEQLSRIFAIAIHECAHHIDGYDYHSEGWRVAVDRLMGEMMRYWPQVKRVAKSIRVRGVVPSVRERTKEAEKKTEVWCEWILSHLLVTPESHSKHVVRLEREFWVPRDRFNLFVYSGTIAEFLRSPVLGPSREKQEVEEARNATVDVSVKWLQEKTAEAFGIDEFSPLNPLGYVTDYTMPIEFWIRPDGFVQMRPADRRTVRFEMDQFGIPMSAVAPVLAQYDDFNKLVNSIINMKLRPEDPEDIFGTLARGEHVIVPYDPYTYQEMLRGYLEALRWGHYQQHGAPEDYPIGTPPSPVNVTIIPRADSHGRPAGFSMSLNSQRDRDWYGWAYNIEGLGSSVEDVVLPAKWQAEKLFEAVPHDAARDLRNDLTVYDVELDRHLFELMLEYNLDPIRPPGQLSEPLFPLLP